MYKRVIFRDSITCFTIDKSKNCYSCIEEFKKSVLIRIKNVHFLKFESYFIFKILQNMRIMFLYVCVIYVLLRMGCITVF